MRYYQVVVAALVSGICGSGRAAEGLYLPSQAVTQLQKRGVGDTSGRFVKLLSDSAVGMQAGPAAASGFFVTPELCVVPAHPMVQTELLDRRYRGGFTAGEGEREPYLLSLRLSDAAGESIVDGQAKFAKLVAVFPHWPMDFAVVRVPSGAHPFLPLADSSASGELLVAGGFPAETSRYLAPEQFAALRQDFLTADARRLSLWAGHFEQAGNGAEAKKLRARARYVEAGQDLLQAREEHVRRIYQNALGNRLGSDLSDLARLDSLYAGISVSVQAIESAFEYSPVLAAARAAILSLVSRDEDSRRRYRQKLDAVLEEGSREPAALATAAQHLAEVGESGLARKAEDLIPSHRSLKTSWSAVTSSREYERVVMHPFAQMAVALKTRAASIEDKGQAVLEDRRIARGRIQRQIQEHCPYPEVRGGKPSLRISVGHATGEADDVMISTLDGHEGMSGARVVNHSGRTSGFLVAPAGNTFSEWTAAGRSKFVPVRNIHEALRSAPHVVREIRQYHR